jgi:hypothetical protein
MERLKDATLAQRFRSLDEIPIPPGVVARLRNGFSPQPRSGVPRLRLSLIGATLIVAAFAIGRATAPPTSLAPTGSVAPAAPSATVARAEPKLIATSREANALIIRMGGLDADALHAVRLLLSNGVDLTPSSFTPAADGSVAMRFELQSRFDFAQLTARIEIPLGSGVWAEQVDLR